MTRHRAAWIGVPRSHCRTASKHGVTREAPTENACSKKLLTKSGPILTEKLSMTGRTAARIFSSSRGDSSVTAIPLDLSLSTALVETKVGQLPSTLGQALADEASSISGGDSRVPPSSNLALLNSTETNAKLAVWLANPFGFGSEKTPTSHSRSALSLAFRCVSGFCGVLCRQHKLG